eukprot:jgi/Chlat1/7365/Chrsp59S06980
MTDVQIVSIENSDTRQGGYVYIAIKRSSGPKPGRVNYPQTPPFGTNPAVLETFSSFGGTPTIFSSSGVRCGFHPDVVDNI